MNEITLTVYGTAKSQGNKTARHNPKTGKSWVVEGSSKSAIGAAEWRRAVSDVARRYQEEHQIPLLTDALDVVMVFVVDRPPSVSLKKRPRPSVKPDPDKLARSILDSLKGTLIKDDGLVVDLRVHKQYATADQPPHARIIIRAASAEPGAALMGTYRRRPTTVEAVLFTNPHDPPPGVQEDHADPLMFFVVTIHGDRAPVRLGDWIITEPDGQHHYPCKPDIFDATYELAE